MKNAAMSNNFSHTIFCKDSFMVRKRMIICLGFVAIGWIAAYTLVKTYCQRMEGTEYDFTLPEEFARLENLFTKPGPPQPGEWLASRIERGQTYQEYLHSTFRESIPPDAVIYVQPLGNFNAEQKKIVEQAAEFLHIYYALPVQMTDSLPLESIPDAAQATRSGTGRTTTDELPDKRSAQTAKA